MRHLTKSELLVMLKNAYLRGMWEHADQKTKSRVDMKGPFRMVDIPDSIVEDLIEEYNLRDQFEDEEEEEE